MSERAQKDEELFDLIAFLITSARGSIEEGPFTSSLRLVDAVPKILDLFPSDDSFLKTIKFEINRGKSKKYHKSDESYIEFLDSLLEKLAFEIRRRNNLSFQVSNHKKMLRKTKRATK
jgi:Family of unknown function (DUF6092)